MWTTDTLPDRVAATEAIIADFSDETGVEVELVGVAEDQFNQVLISSAAAGDLPDVMGSLSLAAIRTLAANDLLDAAAAADVVRDLGVETFSPRALELTREDDRQLSVPSEAWAQLLMYRKDLFEKAGLDAPETYEEILSAAKALDSDSMAGFVGATTPGDAFTQQTFEHLALGNGCDLVDDTGRITIDSTNCVNAFAFYEELISSASTPGTQDVDTVRAAYFAGQAAMFVWSSFVLDEMAGLRNDAKPSCPECRSDPAFLAKNTGIVPAVRGPDGDEPAQFGEVVSWAFTGGRSAETSTNARAFVTYMMSDGYLDWIGFAPEGKFPVRKGTATDPTAYVDAWETLPAGVDTKAPLSEFYPPEVLETLKRSPEPFSRWGITQGQGNLIGASLGELPIPQAIGDLTGGGLDAPGAAEQAAAALRVIQGSLQ